jgi:hypothetical protein
MPFDRRSPTKTELTNRVALNPRVCSPNAASRTALTLSPIHLPSFDRLVSGGKAPSADAAPTSSTPSAHPEDRAVKFLPECGEVRPPVLVVLASRRKEALVDQDYKDAASLAAMVAPYRHARLSAVKLAGDPNNPLRIRDDATAEELRAEVMRHIARLMMRG